MTALITLMIITAIVTVLLTALTSHSKAFTAFSLAMQAVYAGFAYWLATLHTVLFWIVAASYSVELIIFAGMALAIATVQLRKDNKPDTTFNEEYIQAPQFKKEKTSDMPGPFCFIHTNDPQDNA